MTQTRGAMALPLLLLLLLSAASAFAAAYPPLQLPAFTLSELQTSGAATVQRVGAAITQLGMFAVTGLQADEVAHEALSQFVPCAMSGNVKLRDVTMDNGATRRTLATATNASVPQPLPADTLTHCPAFASAAYRLRSAVAAAGAAYAGVLDTLLYGINACATPDTCFAGAAREAESLEHFHLFEPPAVQASTTTAAAASTTATADSPAKEHMLAMHSDIGLFLVMTPAELFDRMDKATAASTAASSSSSSSRLVSAAADVTAPSAAKPAASRRSQDLVVQLPNGSVVTPVLPEGALLVMNGEGLTRWMRMPAGSGTAGKPLPYSPLHEVLSSDMDGGVRAWFGRMFMPLRSATLQQAAVADVAQASKATEYGSHVISVSNAVRQDDGDDEYEDDADGEEEAVQQQEQQQGVGVLTFGEYRQHTYAAFHAGQGDVASAAGCSPTRRLLVDEGSCGADEVYCWHSCMKIAASNLTCSASEAICANAKNTSMLWPRDYLAPGANSAGHCVDCTVMCPAKDGGPPVLPPSRSSFCNTNLGATTMWMTGFQFAKGNEDDPCVVYLFPEWVLDTQGKFAGACIGTFLLGLVVGALGALRTRLKDRWTAEGLWAPDYEPQWRTWTADATIIFIIAVQVCLGYWLMLVAMTYQAELFIMVVLGLACGHLFYRRGSSGSASGRGTAYAAADGAADGGKGGKGSDNYEAGEKLEPCCSV